MATKALVFDADPDRSRFVADLVRSTLGFAVKEHGLSSQGEKYHPNKIEEFKNKYDVIIGYMYGSPSAKEILAAFKDKNRGGRAVLYSDAAMISLADFEDYKLANSLVQFSPGNDQQRKLLIDKIKDAKQERGLFYWISPLKTKEFWAALVGFLVVLLPLITAILRLYEPAAVP